MSHIRIRQWITLTSLLVALFFAAVDCAKKDVAPIPIILDIRASNYAVDDMQINIPREVFIKLTKNPQADKAADPWQDLVIEPTLSAELEEDGNERKLIMTASAAGNYQVRLGSKTNAGLERIIQVMVK